jgi:hypothetical protein
VAATSQEKTPSAPPDLRCPTCGARQAWTDTCRRCKSDLRLLRLAYDAYARHRRLSMNELDAGRLDSALRHALKCQELRPGSEARQLVAVCQLLRGDWQSAIDSASSIERPVGGHDTV